jgi:hypothetical protein
MQPAPYIAPLEVVVDVPPFCPNPDCVYHDMAAAEGTEWFYRTRPFRTLARGLVKTFLCKACRKSCSTQTFSTLYWTHSMGNLEHLENQLVSSDSLRQIGRNCGWSYRAVRTRIQRLARQYLTLFAIALATAVMNEDGVFDGFESFIVSQFFPTNYHILVGADSQAIYGLNALVMRRKGRMTQEQKEMRDLIDAVWRPEPGALREAVRRFFTDCVPMIKRTIETLEKWGVTTDLKPEYVEALHQVPEINEMMERGEMEHHQVSSKQERTQTNPMWPANYIDREIRKDMGEHVRETVKHGREMNCSMERMAIKLGRHTFRKPYRINTPVDQAGQVVTHADRAGFTRNPLVANFEEWLYTRRCVFSHLPKVDFGDGRKRRPLEWIEQIWQRMYENPVLIDPKTGEALEEGQPKEAYFPKHLLV